MAAVVAAGLTLASCAQGDEGAVTPPGGDGITPGPTEVSLTPVFIDLSECEAGTRPWLYCIYATACSKGPSWDASSACSHARMVKQGYCDSGVMGYPCHPGIDPVTGEPVPTPTPLPTPAPTNGVSRYGLPGPIEYTIQPDEMLSEIAERFGVSVEDIVEFNDLPDAELVFAGQIIEIPTGPSQIVERQEANPDPVTAVVLPADGLNVRDQPNTTDSTVQYVAPGGSQLNLTGVVQEIDGLEWYEVEDGNWVQGQFLELGPTAPETTAAPVETTDAPAPTEAATPAPTEAASPAPTAAPDEVLTAVVVPEGGLNMRTAPQPDAEVAYVAAVGTTLTLTGENTVDDGVTWWEIDNGNWVQGQFLRFG